MAGSVVLFQRYIVGTVAIFTENRQEAVAFLSDMFHMPSGAGYLSYNLFIDLFLCTLLMFFLNYRPKRLFNGKLLGVFRAFAVFPIAYEIASITLKILAVEGKVALPLIVFPFLTVKPPMTFLVFVVLAFSSRTGSGSFGKVARLMRTIRRFCKRTGTLFSSPASRQSSWPPPAFWTSSLFSSYRRSSRSTPQRGLSWPKTSTCPT